MIKSAYDYFQQYDKELNEAKALLGSGASDAEIDDILARDDLSHAGRLRLEMWRAAGYFKKDDNHGGAPAAAAARTPAKPDAELTDAEYYARTMKDNHQPPTSNAKRAQKRRTSPAPRGQFTPPANASQLTDEEYYNAVMKGKGGQS